MALSKKPHRSPAEGELPFEYDWEPAQEVLTAYAGIPLIVCAVRSLRVPDGVKAQLHVKRRQRGFDEATYVASFLVLNALGGECLDDFERLREDAGLAEMLGHEMPSPEAARKFLYCSVSECADLLNYWPENKDRPEGEGPLRYVAIRVRKRQGELFAEGAKTRYFAVPSNQREWCAKKLLEWHREKAGTIEALHDVLKNEQAAGVMPCGRFGATAAWLRLAVLTHNVLTGLKRIALKPERLRARPKRLRFHLFFSPGKLIHHARRILERVGRRVAELLEWAEAWQLLHASG